MEDKTLIIRIESILGGQAPTTHFASRDQFRASLGIDPSLASTNDDDKYTSIASGLIRPVGVATATNTTSASPLWIVGNPKATTTSVSYFVTDSQGSAYTYGGATLTSLADGGALSNSSGNGHEYYDNFAYFAKDTTVARYGPLDASVTPEFDGQYWDTTLSLTALSNKDYPADGWAGLNYPNHVLKRHSDGKLYIADVVDNKGTIHYIQTTKGTYEGDTNNASTYNKLQVGYGLWPTAMESYGSDLAIAFFEGGASSGSNANSIQRAKLAFWDTTSQNVNKITWVEYPDPIITAIKNVNGVLYVFSGKMQNNGFRLTRFVGGYTFEEVGLFETGQAPLPGGVDGQSDSLILASYTKVPETAPCVYALGLHKNKLSKGLFNIARGRTQTTGSSVSATCLSYDAYSGNLNQQGILFGIAAEDGGHVCNTYQASINTDEPPVWWSQTYRIGQGFKIKKIRVPITKTLAATNSIVPKIYVDDGRTSYTLQTINSTNYTLGERTIVLRPENAFGWYDFWLELKWTGTGTITVGLPITIEYELVDD